MGKSLSTQTRTPQKPMAGAAFMSEVSGWTGSLVNTPGSPASRASGLQNWFCFHPGQREGRPFLASSFHNDMGGGCLFLWLGYLYGRRVGSIKREASGLTDDRIYFTENNQRGEACGNHNEAPWSPHKGHPSNKRFARAKGRKHP